jgi:hypothetical protein
MHWYCKRPLIATLAIDGQGDFEEIDFLFGKFFDNGWRVSYMTSANTEDDRETKRKLFYIHCTYLDTLQMLNIYVIQGQASQYGPDPSASRVFLRNLTIEVTLPLNLASTPALVRSRHGRHYL